MKQKRLAYIWLSMNLLGMALYLVVASTLWVRPEDQGMPGGPGDAFAWLCTVVPVLFIFVIINAIALFRVIAEYRRTRNIVPALLWIIVFSVWLNVLLFDHIKSVRYVDLKYAQHGAHQSVEKG
jgi:uncharacterized membrane protein YhdT